MSTFAVSAAAPAAPAAPAASVASNNTLFKPYIKSGTRKRKMRIYFQAGITPDFNRSGPAGEAYETLKKFSNENTLFIDPDEGGKLQKFIVDNDTPRGIKFCAKTTGVPYPSAGVPDYAEESVENRNNFVLTARIDPENLETTQAFLTATVKNESDEQSMAIDLLCSRKTPSYSNVGASLISVLFLVCQRLAIPTITLDAVEDRVGYYSHLGFGVGKKYGGLTRMKLQVPTGKIDFVNKNNNNETNKPNVATRRRTRKRARSNKGC